MIFGLTSKDPLPVTKPERIVALKALVMTQPLKIKPDYDASAIKKLIKQIFIVLKRNESEGDSSVNIVGGDEESWLGSNVGKIPELVKSFIDAIK